MWDRQVVLVNNLAAAFWKMKTGLDELRNLMVKSQILVKVFLWLLAEADGGSRSHLQQWCGLTWLTESLRDSVLWYLWCDDKSSDAEGFMSVSSSMNVFHESAEELADKWPSVSWKWLKSSEVERTSNWVNESLHAGFVSADDQTALVESCSQRLLHAARLSRGSDCWSHHTIV